LAKTPRITMSRACAALAFALRRLGAARRLAPPRRAAEVVEEFAEHVEMIAPAFGFAADRAQHGVKYIHHFPPFVEAREFAHELVEAAASAEADVAHKNSARCARSPRSLKVWIRSGISFPQKVTPGG